MTEILERIDAFCGCGHKVCDFDPRYNFSGFIKCEKCKKSSALFGLKTVRRVATKEEVAMHFNVKEISTPYYGRYF